MSQQNKRLENKVAIITGSSRGLGMAFAKRFAREGARLVLCDVRDCAPVVREIQAEGGEALGMKVDITVEREVVEMAEKAVGHFGKIDVLVNNAAISGGLETPDFMKPYEELTSADWDRMLAVNVKGTFLCCKAVIPQMKKQRRGNIVNIGSTTGFNGEPGFLHYSTSKGGLMTMTRGLARALGDFDINVNAVAPGVVMTESMRLLISEEEEKRLVQRQLLKRSIQPEDIASAVVFLASDEASMITGQMLSVNGGEYLH
jgi:NAD(P)-dependent dehydrogenase (short-subunit alcohol dehydrogenase family)